MHREIQKPSSVSRTSCKARQEMSVTAALATVARLCRDADQQSVVDSILVLKSCLNGKKLSNGLRSGGILELNFG